MKILSVRFQAILRSKEDSDAVENNTPLEEICFSKIVVPEAWTLEQPAEWNVTVLNHLVLVEITAQKPLKIGRAQKEIHLPTTNC